MDKLSGSNNELTGMKKNHLGYNDQLKKDIYLDFEKIDTKKLVAVTKIYKTLIAEVLLKQNEKQKI